MVIVKFGGNCEIWWKFWNLVEIVKCGGNCEIWWKTWNLVEIVKFGWNCEIWWKLWNSVEIVKFGGNCEIWWKLWNLVEIVKFCQKKILSVKNKGYPAGHRLKIKDNSAGHWDRWPPRANFGPILIVCPGLVGDEEVVFTSDSLSGKTTLLFFYSKDFGGDPLTIHPTYIHKNMFKPRARHAWMW